MKKLIVPLLLLFPLSAQAITLQWPVDCTLGKDCFLQNFADHDSSKGWKDYACEASSYDAHDGTDIRLRSLQAMREGVKVLAVAEGKVLRMRDGVEDISIRNIAPELVKDRECGNGMIVQHADGFQTMYCHMKRGSLAVKPGDKVKAGQVLGEIGLSGNTEFPHLHLTVLKGKEKLDPFTGAAIAQPCNKNSGKGMWENPIPYQPTALLGDGFMDMMPEVKTMRDTPIHRSKIAAHAPVLAYWVEAIGLRAGDMLLLRITAPDGKELAGVRQKIDMPKAAFFQFVGKRNRATLVAGTYRAEFLFTRDGKVIASSQRETVVK